MTSQTQAILTTILIKAPSDIFIRYDINNNWIQGIREYLLSVPITCFLTNYDLVIEKTLKKLDDNESIFEVGLNDYDIIEIKPCLYNKNKLLSHIKRLQYLLNDNCPCFYKNGPITPNIVSKNKEEIIIKAKEYFNQINEIKTNIDKEINKEENKSNQTDNSNKVEKIENKNEQFKEKEEQNSERVDSKTLKKQKEIEGKNIQESVNHLLESYQKIVETDFLTFHFSTYPQSALYEYTTQSKQKKYKCLYSIVFSVLNQVIANKNPDSVYLEISTLENKTLYVTCNEHGFYLNNSHLSEGLLYIDDTPNKVPCASFTLVGLLTQASHTFNERFTKLISQVIDSEPLLYSPSPEMSYNWLVQKEKIENDDKENFYSYTFDKYIKENVDNNKVLNRLNKEWNEEFFAFLDINFNNDPIQNLTKEKLLFEFYTIFKRTAIEGVKLIREKKISPFTFFESPKTNEFYYMYSNIIFTILEDSYMSNRTYSNDELKQSYLGSNLDLKHVNFLNKFRTTFGLNKLYTPLNCIVQYMGLRCHCQVLTPGVIFNSDNLVCYGEGEEGVIKFNDNFHQELEKLYKRINIKAVKVEDKNKKVVTIYGNPEIKGVIGVDKRKYLFDMIHLLPRDLNYYKENDEKYNEDNRGCLIRPEVVLKYKEKLIKNEIDKSTYHDTKQEDRTKIVKEIVDKINSEVLFNTNFGITPKKLKIIQEHQKESENDKIHLNKLANYLKQDLIDDFLSEVLKEVENETAPIDCHSLSQYLHSYGINCRYLGEIHKRIGKKNWLTTLIERDIIRRSAKHLFNEILSNCPYYLINEVTCHFLNIIFAPRELLNELDKKKVLYYEGEVVFEDEINHNHNTKNSENEYNNQNTTSSSSNHNNHKKKKNKGKNKQNQQTSKKIENDETNVQLLLQDLLNNKSFSTIYHESPETLSHLFPSPKEIWEKISKISQNHFNFKFDFSLTYIEPVINKHGLLRDFCKSVGIQLEANTYSLYESSSLQKRKKLSYSFLPFKKTNIVQFFPIIKDYFLPSDFHFPLYEEALQASKTPNFHDYAEKYRQLIYTSNEIYGPINKYSAFAYKKLAEVAFFERDFFNGVSILFKAITIYEKCSEWDCSEVINCYVLLSTFTHFLGDVYMSFVLITRGLELAYYTMPKNNPELITKYISIGMYYVDQEMYDKGKYIVDSCVNICNNYYNKTDRCLQRPLLLISQLSLKSFDILTSISSYEKYLVVIQNKGKHGEEVLQSLKHFEKEVKNSFTGKKFSKDIDKEAYNELMRIVVSPLFWDDLEKPILSTTNIV